MGCCPSKHKADKEAHDEYPPTEKVDVDFTLSETSINVHHSSRDAAAVRHAPSNMLMDRGDGQAIERSDHESVSEVEAVERKVDGCPIDHEVVLSVRTADDVLPQENVSEIREEGFGQASGLRPQLSMLAPSPSRPVAVCSPSKPPINYEDMPINSMYHRIHMIEMEEMEAKRRQEQQEEAERREREIQEFKAASLTSTNG